MRPLNVLVACEFSGRVKTAFRKLGDDAWSCDLLPSEISADPYHIQGDILDVWRIRAWDLMIAHPPCTHLAVSGARWFKGKEVEQDKAVDFFRWLLDLPIPHIAVENPIGIISSRIRKPDQIIQPWQFGHPETKATCLWLYGLPLLHPTNLMQPLFHSIHKEPPSPDRWKNRSRTFPGIAEAMATQWSAYVSKVLQETV